MINPCIRLATRFNLSEDHALAYLKQVQARFNAPLAHKVIVQFLEQISESIVL